MALTHLKLIIAGGISGNEDIVKLKKIEDKGISGIIIGKALYEGMVDLKNAIDLAGEK